MKNIIILAVLAIIGFGSAIAQEKKALCVDGQFWVYKIDKESPVDRTDIIPNGKGMEYRIECKNGKLGLVVDGVPKPKFFSFFVPTVSGIPSENPWFKPESAKENTWDFTYDTSKTQGIWNGNVTITDGTKEKTVPAGTFKTLEHVRQDWIQLKRSRNNKEMTYYVIEQKTGEIKIEVSIFADILWDNGTKIEARLKDYGVTDGVK